MLNVVQMKEKRDPIFISEESFSCNGGGGALGHPKIYLTFGKRADIDCPYCGRHFHHDPNESNGRIDGVTELGDEEH